MIVEYGHDKYDLSGFVDTESWETNFTFPYNSESTPDLDLWELDQAELFKKFNSATILTDVALVQYPMIANKPWVVVSGIMYVKPGQEIVNDYLGISSFNRKLCKLNPELMHYQRAYACLGTCALKIVRVYAPFMIKRSPAQM
jgi:hypothetical protein